MKVRFTILLILTAVLCFQQVRAEMVSDILTGSNVVRQTSNVGSNYFMGNVGVGTNSPAVKLDVAGVGRFTGGIVFVERMGNLSMGIYTNRPSL